MDMDRLSVDTKSSSTEDSDHHHLSLSSRTFSEISSLSSALSTTSSSESPLTHQENELAFALAHSSVDSKSTIERHKEITRRKPPPPCFCCLSGLSHNLRFASASTELRFCRRYYGDYFAFLLAVFSIAFMIFVLYLIFDIVTYLTVDWDRPLRDDGISYDIELVSATYPYRTPQIGVFAILVTRMIEVFVPALVVLFLLIVYLIFNKLTGWKDINWRIANDEGNVVLLDGTESLYPKLLLWFPTVMELIVLVGISLQSVLISSQGPILRAYQGVTIFYLMALVGIRARVFPVTLILALLLLFSHISSWAVFIAISDFTWMSLSEMIFALAVPSIAIIGVLLMSIPSERILRECFVAETKTTILANLLSSERKRQIRLLENIFPKSLTKVVLKRELPFVKTCSNTVVCVNDIIGFTSFCSDLLETSENRIVFDVLNQIYSGFDRITIRNSMEKVKTIGDAHFSFGLKWSDLCDDEEEAIRSGLVSASQMIRHFRKVVEKRFPNLGLRTGLSIGNVVIYILAGVFLTFDVTGEAVGEAWSLEASCEPGAIHCSRKICSIVDLDSVFDSSSLRLDERDSGSVMVSCFEGSTVLVPGKRKKRKKNTIRDRGKSDDKDDVECCVSEGEELGRWMMMKKKLRELVLIPGKLNIVPLLRFSLRPGLVISSFVVRSALILSACLSLLFLFPITTSRLILFLSITALILFSAVLGSLLVRFNTVVVYFFESIILLLSSLVGSYSLFDDALNSSSEWIPQLDVYPDFAKPQIFATVLMLVQVSVAVAVGLPFVVKCVFMLLNVMLSLFIVIDSGSMASLLNVSTGGVIGLVGAYSFHLAMQRSFALNRRVQNDLGNLSKSTRSNRILLESCLPPSILDRLLQKGVEFQSVAEYVEFGCSLFVILSTIEDEITSVNSKELERFVWNMNSVFESFDQIITSLDCFKVKSIGARYLAIAPLEDDEQTSIEKVFTAAMAMLEEEQSSSFRIGLACGPISAGVCGESKVLYDTFGDTINQSCRMSETAPARSIQCTREFYEGICRFQLESNGCEGMMLFKCRENVLIKGKGVVETWVLRTGLNVMNG